MFEVDTDIIVDRGGVDIMQNKDIYQVHKEGEIESSCKPGFRSACDEKFDPRNLFNKLPSTERIVNEGSSSLHSSRALIMMTIEMPPDYSGSTINLSIWLYSGSSTMSGSNWRREMR